MELECDNHVCWFVCIHVSLSTALCVFLPFRIDCLCRIPVGVFWSVCRSVLMKSTSAGRSFRHIQTARCNCKTKRQRRAAPRTHEGRNRRICAGDDLVLVFGMTRHQLLDVVMVAGGPLSRTKATHSPKKTSATTQQIKQSTTNGTTRFTTTVASSNSTNQPPCSKLLSFFDKTPKGLNHWTTASRTTQDLHRCNRDRPSPVVGSECRNSHQRLCSQSRFQSNRINPNDNDKLDDDDKDSHDGDNDDTDDGHTFG